MAENQNVAITAWPNQAAHVEFSINTKDAFPVCIRVCEPICATSDYHVGIEVFDRPVVAIRVKGVTRFAACDQRVG